MIGFSKPLGLGCLPLVLFHMFLIPHLMQDTSGVAKKAPFGERHLSLAME